jgi:hypothetical protein
LDSAPAIMKKLTTGLNNMSGKIAKGVVSVLCLSLCLLAGVGQPACRRKAHAGGVFVRYSCIYVIWLAYYTCTFTDTPSHDSWMVG